MDHFSMERACFEPEQYLHMIKNKFCVLRLNLNALTNTSGAKIFNEVDLVKSHLQLPIWPNETLVTKFILTVKREI